MKLTYSFQKKEEYLIFHISGEYEKMEFLTYPTIIMQECDKEKIYKVLVNGLGLENPKTPAMDRFYLGEEVAKTIGSKVKLAVVWHQYDLDYFAENVAVNRGGHVKAFGEVAEAEKWLLNVS